MFAIEYRRPARKALTRLPTPVATQFLAAFESLAVNLERSDLDIKPLMGRDGYRLRIARLRALYRIENDRMVILVVEIGSRGDLYK